MVILPLHSRSFAHLLFIYQKEQVNQIAQAPVLEPKGAKEEGDAAYKDNNKSKKGHYIAKTIEN